jgi:hypothetical protein
MDMTGTGKQNITSTLLQPMLVGGHKHASPELLRRPLLYIDTSCCTSQRSKILRLLRCTHALRMGLVPVTTLQVVLLAELWEQQYFLNFF